MKDITLLDIKELIDTSIGQSEARLSAEINGGFTAVREEMADGFTAVREEMADGFAGVGEVFIELNDRIDDANRHSNRRITRLESKII